MHLDPTIPTICIVALITLVTGLVLQRFRQPLVICYILVGVLVGPFGLKLVTDTVLIERLGAVGVLLLLFAVGAEINISELAKQWRIPIIGTIIQIVVSVSLVGLLGYFMDWPLARIILLGFVISLSSTAVIIKLLQDRNLVGSQMATDIIGVLLVQDLAIVPMMIILGQMAGEGANIGLIARQLFGALAIVVVLIWVIKRGGLPRGVLKRIQSSHEELHMLFALLICFGMALVSYLLGLSGALGAFVAGIVVASTRESGWIGKSIDSFRIVLVATFFVSVGMLIDLPFIGQRWIAMGGLVLTVFLTNTFVNAGMVKVLGYRWEQSLIVGAYLAQIGEFSFVLAHVGRRLGLISEVGYQMTIGTISLTLLLSPMWVSLFEKRSRKLLQQKNLQGNPKD